VETTPLRELLPQYPPEAPQTLRELVSSDSSDLNELDDAVRAVVFELRRQTIDAIHAFERDPILCPDDLVRQLTTRRIPMLAKRWMVVCLDRNGDRIAVRRAQGGGMRWLQEPYSALPTPSELASNLRLPQGGKYLLIWGGGPDVLEDAGTVAALKAIVSDLPVADITLWWLRTGQAPTLFSVRAGAGDQSGARVELDQPQLDTLTRAFNERSHDGHEAGR
jgi:hypothetical protein